MIRMGMYPAVGCRLIGCRKHFGYCSEVMHLPEHNPKQNKVTKRIFPFLWHSCCDDYSDITFPVIHVASQERQDMDF